MTIRKLVQLILLFLAAWICTIAFHLPIVHHPGKTTNLYPIHAYGKYGYVNQAGKLAIAPQFDSASEFVDGVGIVRVNSKSGAIDLQGKTIVPIQYEQVGVFSEGLAPVRVNGKWGFVNSNGEMTIPAKYDEVGRDYAATDEKVFSEGLASVKQNGKWGLIDGHVKQNGKWGFIDRNGKQVIPFRFDEVTAFFGGIASVKSGDFLGTIDTAGKWKILTSAFSNFPMMMPIPFFQGMWVDPFIQPGTSIYYDKQGRFIGSYPGYPPKLAREFQEGLAIVWEPPPNAKQAGINYPIPAFSRYNWIGTKCGFQDETGRVAIDLKFDQCRLFKEGVAAVKVKDKWGYIDKTGQFVAPPQFDYADDFFEGRALVVLNKKSGFIDLSGQLIVSPKFDIDDSSLGRDFELPDLEFYTDILPPHRFYNGFAKIIQGNKCGYLDRTGKIAIPPQFSSCSPFDRYGIAKVERGLGLYEEAYINRQGKIFIANFNRDTDRLIVSVLGCILWVAAISLHEFGHAIVAYWGGDRSVKEKGYLSFNPIKYFNPITSLILPVFAFAAGGFVLPGAAVYLDEDQIRNRCWKTAMAAAGPIGSALFGLLLVPIFHLSLAAKSPQWLSAFLAFFISLQFIMMLFNLIPIPPLDGYRIFYPWFPSKWQNQTLLALSSLMGLIIFFIVPLFVPATAIVFFPLFEGVDRITESLGISPAWVLKGSALFDRNYTALTLLVASLVYFSYKLELIFKIAGLLLEFMAAIIGKREVKMGRWKFDRSTINQLALAAYEQATKIEPKDDWSWQKKAEFIKKVDVLQSLQSSYQATHAYEKAIKLNPLKWEKQIPYLFYYDEEEQLDFIEAVLKLNPQSYYAWRSKAIPLSRLNRDEAALTALKKAIEINPKYEYIWEDWERKGWCLERLKRYEEALEAYEKRLELSSCDPHCARGWKNKGRCLQKMNRVEEALAAYEKSYENAAKLGFLTNAAGIKQEIGKYLQQLNRHEEARTAFEQAIELISDYRFAYDNKLKGDLLEQLNRCDEARIAYEQAIQGCSERKFWYYNSYIDVFKDYQEAIVCCEKVLQTKPENALAWSLRAMALQEIGCYEAAIHSFDLAIENQINHQQKAYIWYNKGVSLDRLKRYPEALDYYHQAIEKAIELELPSYTLQHFWFVRGLTLLHLNRHEDALEAYLQSQGLNPSSIKRRDGNLIEIYKPS